MFSMKIAAAGSGAVRRETFFGYGRRREGRTVSGSSKRYRSSLSLAVSPLTISE